MYDIFKVMPNKYGEKVEKVYHYDYPSLHKKVIRLLQQLFGNKKSYSKFIREEEEEFIKEHEEKLHK